MLIPYSLLRGGNSSQSNQVQSISSSMVDLSAPGDGICLLEDHLLLLIWLYLFYFHSLPEKKSENQTSTGINGPESKSLTLLPNYRCLAGQTIYRRQSYESLFKLDSIEKTWPACDTFTRERGKNP